MHIAPELIDADADKVVRRLAGHGHRAYLVGGCVRDLLLGRSPKDFDVATSATPTDIKRLFRNCRIIGRRFRLAHIFFGPHIIETSTFRANPREDAGDSEELLIRRDNVFGSETEDAKRRDFTINGLFYDVEAEEVIDHVGGLGDLAAGLVRTIGDPDIRFREDPVRMMRAIKFAARLGFAVEERTFAALIRHRGEIRKCAQPRVLEELYRLLRSGAAHRSVELLVETGLAARLSGRFAALFGSSPRSTSDPAPADEVGRAEAADVDIPSAPRAAPDPAPVEDDEERLWRAIWSDEDPVYRAPPAATLPLPDEEVEPAPMLALSFIEDPEELMRRRELSWSILRELDKRVAGGHETTNALALAAAAAPFVLPEILDEATRPAEAGDLIHELLGPLAEELRLARRDTERTGQILLALRRLEPARRRRGKPLALVRRDCFDEALAVYELLAEASGREDSDIDYWRKLQREDGGGSEDDRSGKKRRRRRGGRRRRGSEAGDGETAAGDGL